MFEISKIYNIDLPYEIYTVLGAGTKEDFFQLLCNFQSSVYMYLEPLPQTTSCDAYREQAENNVFYKQIIEDERFETKLIEIPLRTSFGHHDNFQTRLEVKLYLSPFETIQFFK